MGIEREMRSGAWHGDLPIHLAFPPGWKVTVHWPRTPARLTDAQILECLEKPVGQPRIRELCKGKSRPLVVIDDVNRPTPTDRVIPHLLKEFEAAGIPPAKVTFLMARGSHGEPNRESMLRKFGEVAASSCRVLLHDPYRHTKKIGKTSLGTPVHVNKEVLEADFVMGIGGVYPNNTAGFGGGAKLALGVMDIRVISELHNKHNSVGWGKQGSASSFRRDLEEMARMIKLETLITAHVDADRELVRLRCGDYRLYYDDEVEFCRAAFSAPKPGDADVVISNAYPNDLSLTFVHAKGLYPLRFTAAGASRIVLAACSEGEGFHGVYPVVRKPRFHDQRDRLRRLSLVTPGEMAIKILRRITGKSHSSSFAPAAPPTPQAPTEPKNPIWLYRTGNYSDVLPSPVRGMQIESDWSKILKSVRQEQGGRDNLNVVVYPCTPLQIFE